MRCNKITIQYTSGPVDVFKGAMSVHVGDHEVEIILDRGEQIERHRISRADIKRITTYSDPVIPQGPGP